MEKFRIPMFRKEDRPRNFLRRSKIKAHAMSRDEMNSESPDYKILTCPSCGAKNRIPSDKTPLNPKCGKCHAPLENSAREKPVKVTLRCSECRTKNRISSDKIEAPAKCGKCGAALKTGDELLTSPIMVTDTDFKEKILKSPLPVLLYAWAPWCPTCRQFMPNVDAFAADARGKVRTAKINVDAAPKTASAYDILSVPRILIFDKGDVKEDIAGALEKHYIMVKMGHYIYK